MNYINRPIVVAAAFLALVSALAQSALATVTDVTSDFTITKSGLVLNRTSDTYDTTVIIKNISSTTKEGLIQVIVVTSPMSVTLANAQGETSDGKSFALFAGEDSHVAPGQTASGILQFNNPQRVAFTTALSIRNETIPPSPDIRVGEIRFYTPGGNAGHPSVTTLQGLNPTAGEILGFGVQIFGNLKNAHYKLLGNEEQEIASGALEDFGGGAERFASVVVPSEKFAIEVEGIDENGNNFTWRSDVYNPAPVSLKILLPKSHFKAGDLIPISIQLLSTSAGELPNYTLTLSLPKGFSGDAGPWVISPVQGQAVEITSSLIAPDGENRDFVYDIEVEAIPFENTAFESLISKTRLIVE